MATEIDNTLGTHSVLDAIKDQEVQPGIVKSTSTIAPEVNFNRINDTSIQSVTSTNSDAANTRHISHTRKNASLYVGELNSQVTEADLYTLFSPIGSISFIRVCRDAVSKKSLGYAYVNFIEPADSERAMTVLNHEPLCGRNIRIMHSQRDPGARRNTSGNLFVKNLDPAIDNRDLHETFSNFGRILSCKIAVNEDGVSKGYGFVHFEDPHAAEMAIRNVNGMMLNEKRIFVGPHIPRDLRVVEKNGNQFTNIYVKNIKCNTEEELRSIFEKYGSIVSVCLSRDSNCVPRGFGFVNFKEPQAAARAMEELNDKNINGINIKISRAQTHSERKKELQKQYNAWCKSAANANTEAMSPRYPGVNLYVKNLDFQITDDLLRETFQRFGTITSCRVMIDENGNSRGFGFLCFASADDAAKAMQEMNKCMLMSKPLYVGLAQRKEERLTYIRKHIESLDKVGKQHAIASRPGLPGNRKLVPPEEEAYRSSHLENSFVARQPGYNNWQFDTVPGGNSDNFKLRRSRVLRSPVRPVGPPGPAGPSGSPRILNLMDTLATSSPELHTRIIGSYLYFKVLKHERVGGNEQLAGRVVEILLGNQVEAVHMADNDHALAQVVSQVVDSLVRG
jgi:polyadenylate-binding protein